MHICFISTEIFAWGKYGGFGRATRTIGKELSQRGIQVSAIVPRRNNQPREALLDGIRVFGFDKNELLSSKSIYAQIEADIYHSQEPSFGTFLAQQAQPHMKHIVTFRDTRTLYDWFIELRLPSRNYGQVLFNNLYEDNFYVHRAVRNASGKYGASYYVAKKAKRKYQLKEMPALLPTPVKIPQKIEKAAQPTVCFNSRWDRRKRPELFFELARSFPDVKFIALGKSQDAKREEKLRSKYSDLPNLELRGFINQFESSELASILEKSWILVNTSAREGLPNSFIEAAASGCAILSTVDPDNFASLYGYHIEDNDFKTGLINLLRDNHWQTQGQRGRAYVKDVFDEKKAIDQHIKIYQRLIS